MTPDAIDSLLDQLAGRIAIRLQQPPPEAGEEAASPWLSAASAAVYLDWPLQRLYKLTAQSLIPHYKHDGRLLFNRQELDRWLGDFRQPGDWLTREKRAISD